MLSFTALSWPLHELGDDTRKRQFSIVGILADGRMGNLTVALYRDCTVHLLSSTGGERSVVTLCYVCAHGLHIGLSCMYLL